MSRHFNWVIANFNVIAYDTATESVYFKDGSFGYAEINGGAGQFSCDSTEDFWNLVEMFHDETFEE